MEQKKLESMHHQEQASFENFVMGNDVAASGEEHSTIWGMFMAATCEEFLNFSKFSQEF